MDIIELSALICKKGAELTINMSKQQHNFKAHFGGPFAF